MMLKRTYLCLIFLICLGKTPNYASENVEHPAIILSAGTSILIDQAEDGPVKRAVQDLVRDIKKILGQAPRVVHSLKDVDKKMPLIVVTCKANSTKAFRDEAITKFESHLITSANIGGYKSVVLQGADMRGTIYAIYSFSEKFLHIPPLWIWTSYQPERKSMVLIPAQTHLYFPPPTVKWRAWFQNDKDLLSPWQAKNAENYDAVYETMLRLKLNTREGYLMDMESWKTPYKASKEACYVRDRGLMISFTHTAPFGATLTNWERYWVNVKHQKAPPLILKNIETLKEFWTYHIETIKREKLDVIWQIGFRGLGDKPFWRKTFIDAMDEPKADKDRAEIINNMLGLQVDLLKKEIGELHPLMKITIYNEGSEFLAAGLLKLPDEPNLILNYSGVRGDHYPPPEIQKFDQRLLKRPIGYYLNFQFTGTGSHLVAGEGPWKMEQNYRYLEQKIQNPLTFSVVNTGNVREHVLELSANASMMWDYDSYQTDRFIDAYCTQYYGKTYASQITALYKNYYNAYWAQRKADINGFDRQYVFQDLRYARGLTQIATLWNRPYMENPFNDQNKGIGGAMATDGRQFNIVPADNDAKSQVDAAIKGAQQAVKKFEQVADQASVVYQKLPVKSKAFFNNELLIPALFMEEVNIAFSNMVEGYKAKQQNKLIEAKVHVQNVSESLGKLKVIKAKGNYERFNDWSLPEKNFGIDSIHNDILDLLKKMQ